MIQSHGHCKGPGKERAYHKNAEHSRKPQSSGFPLDIYGIFPVFPVQMQWTSRGSILSRNITELYQISREIESHFYSRRSFLHGEEQVLLILCSHSPYVKVNRTSLIRCWWECKMMQLLWKTVWWFLHELLRALLYDPAAPLRDICPREVKTYSKKDLYVNIHSNTIHNSQKAETT